MMISDEVDLLTNGSLQRTESCRKELAKASNEMKIQKLKEQTASQSKEMSNLKRQLAEAKEALGREMEATSQLCVQVKKQKQTIMNRQIEAMHFKSEMKKQKNELEAAITELSKSEEEKIELKATLNSVQKEGLQINQTLKEEKRKGERQTRKLTELKNKVDVLQTETAELHDAVAIFQNEVAGLKSEKAKLMDANLKQKFEIELTGQMINKMQSQMCSVIYDYEEQKEILESEINEHKLTVQEYALSLKNIEKKLENTKTNTKTTCERLRAYKVRSDTRAKIIEADKETQAEMENNITALMKENVRLRRELNSGFIGRYRQMKRFYGRVVHAIFRC